MTDTVCGIYKISLDDGRCYVGQSADINRRWSEHRNALSKVDYDHHTSPYLRNAWNKYGEDAFTFEILEECEPESLTEREQFWMDCTNSIFNVAPAAGSVLGIKRTPEQRAKLSASLRQTFNTPDVCVVEDCDRTDIKGYGYCKLHYQRFKIHGDPTIVYVRGYRPPSDPMQRILERVNQNGPYQEVLGSQCWLWLGPLDTYGRGKIYINHQQTSAHRAACEAFSGTIPEGRMIQFSCSTFGCVNPAHMFHSPWTPWNASKEFCTNGHVFDDDNTIINRRTGKRSCRVCSRESQRRYRERQNSMEVAA